MALRVHFVSVFTSPDSPGAGGNLAPIVLDASDMSDQEMQALAKSQGHESSFVLPPPPGSGADYRLRFFVPEHEMEMCGHATVGTTWLLKRLGLLGDKAEVKFYTLSGMVTARVAATQTDAANIMGDDEPEILVEVSQPQGWVETITDETLKREVCDVLNVPLRGEFAPMSLPTQNASTSRVKTLVPVSDVETLNTLRPDFSRIKGLCERLESTGLYPYAFAERNDSSDTATVMVHARQFPRASGYPEDAATGIAAAALAFALLDAGRLNLEQTLTVRQGEAMGCLSEIGVRIEDAAGVSEGAMMCWVGGTARLVTGVPSRVVGQ